MTVVEILTILVTALGVFFLLVSSIGLLRMPDLYTRVHTSGKAGTLGIVGVLLGVAVYYYANWFIAAEMIALVVFFFFTGPAAAHMLDRAAYLTGVKPLEGTYPNELDGKYNRETRHLR